LGARPLCSVAVQQPLPWHLFCLEAIGLAFASILPVLVRSKLERSGNGPRHCSAPSTSTIRPPCCYSFMFIYVNQACLAASFPVAQISPRKNLILTMELLCSSVPHPNQSQNQDIMQLNSSLTSQPNYNQKLFSYTQQSEYYGGSQYCPKVDTIRSRGRRIPPSQPKAKQSISPFSSSDAPCTILPLPKAARRNSPQDLEICAAADAHHRAAALHRMSQRETLEILPVGFGTRPYRRGASGLARPLYGGISSRVGALWASPSLLRVPPTVDRRL
jgi:hypothetical protein